MIEEILRKPVEKKSSISYLCWVLCIDVSNKNLNHPQYHSRDPSFFESRAAWNRLQVLVVNLLCHVPAGNQQTQPCIFHLGLAMSKFLGRPQNHGISHVFPWLHRCFFWETASFFVFAGTTPLVLGQKALGVPTHAWAVLENPPWGKAMRRGAVVLRLFFFCILLTWISKKINKISTRWL